MGAAMAITAFPMLARIIYERGLTGTPLGTLALAAGAIGDAGAWCVLAIVLARNYATPIGAALSQHERIGALLFVGTTALAVVLRLDYGQTRFLFASDIDKRDEAVLARRTGSG